MGYYSLKMKSNVHNNILEKLKNCIYLECMLFMPVLYVVIIIAVNELSKSIKLFYRQYSLNHITQGCLQ